MLRSPKLHDILDGQLLVHPRLGGVPQDLGGDQVKAERAVRLFVAVAGARQVKVDLELFDALTAPLEDLISTWLGSPEAKEGKVFLRPESFADLLSTISASGVNGGKLPELLSGLFSQQHEESSPGYEVLAGGSMIDLCNMAHAFSLMSHDVEEPIRLLWTTAEPQLRSAKPHLALMMLNAVVRGGSQEVLTSPELLGLVDELLVQKLDFDSEALGRLAS